MILIIATVVIFFVTMFIYLHNSQILKTRDLRHLEQGIDYIVDFNESENSAILTTAVSLEQNEKIILPYCKKAVMYRVEDIQQYCNDDIKIVLLQKIGVVSEER